MYIYYTCYSAISELKLAGSVLLSHNSDTPFIRTPLASLLFKLSGSIAFLATSNKDCLRI